MNTVAILGCGWLGFPLAKAMLGNNMVVNGSTMSKEKLEVLANEGISPYLISINENAVEGDIAGFLNTADILIIDIPPKAKNGENFIEKMHTLIPNIEKSGIGLVLFTSSISVYGSNQGFVAEDTIPEPDAENGKQLLVTESLFRNSHKFKTTIIRFGGLIGEDRHPVKHLAGKENLPDPDAPVNLIHRNDCIEIILKVIQNNIWGETFNAVAPFHPTRKEYYTQKAAEAGLALPLFSDEKKSVGKIIESQKIQEMLRFAFAGGI